jgi:hypothetical protein
MTPRLPPTTAYWLTGPKSRYSAPTRCPRGKKRHMVTHNYYHYYYCFLVNFCNLLFPRVYNFFYSNHIQSYIYLIYIIYNDDTNLLYKFIYFHFSYLFIIISDFLGDKTMSYGKITSLSILEQRQSLPIFTLREKLLQAVDENQVLVVIGETGSGILLFILIFSL